MRALRVCSFGSQLVKYDQALHIQDALTALRKVDKVPDTLLLLQHTPVYTIGKRGTDRDFKVSLQELQLQGNDIFNSARGGETTFHGPGQVVAYPILNLKSLKVGARAYVESLEDIIIRTVGIYGVHASGRAPGLTGVWVADRKIAAIGVRISHGISSHGLALNVTTNLKFFDNIIPCGIHDKKMTSLRQETGMGIDLQTVAEQLRVALQHQFQYDTCTEVAPEAVLQQECSSGTNTSAVV